MAAVGTTTTVAANNEDNDEEEEDSTRTDYLVLLFCCILAALWCSITAVVVGVYAYCEDRLLRQDYLQRGLPASATVVACTVVRIMTDQPEYNVRLAYNYRTATTEAIHAQKHPRNSLHIIYKDIKLLASDLVSFDVSTNDGSQNGSLRNSGLSWNSSLHIPHEVVMAYRHGRSGGATTGNANEEQDAHHHHHHHQHDNYVGQSVDVLILPGHPRSGLPLKYVERLCSWGYRLPTLVLVLTAISLAILCATMVLGHAVAVGLVVLLTLGETAFVIGCGGPVLQKSLYDRYLVSDGTSSVSSTFTDDTTLSSGDDSYLRIA